jgi:GDP-L-fucose synthase
MNVIVIGATGLLGSAVARANPGCVQINSKHFDATDSHSTHEWFLEHRDLVANSTIHICCGRVAGIGGQRDYAMFTENMRMAMNTLECAKQFQTTGTTVYYSSSCVYPAHLDVFDETDMLTGDFEVSNEGYAFAKAAGQRMCQYLNKQKIMFAKREAQPVVTVWGSPKTRREFLRSDDVALGTLHFLNCESTVENVNIGYGEDIEIGTVVQGLCDRIGYTGAVEYTADRVGKTRRLLRVDCIRELGWQHSNSHDDMLDYMVEEATRRGLS